MFDIALFVLIFNLSLSFVNELGLTNAAVPIGMSSVAIEGKSVEEWAKQEGEMINTTATRPAQGIDTQAVFSYLNAFYHYGILGLPRLVMIFFNATAGIPLLLGGMGIPIELNVMLTTIVWVIYTLGFYQIFSKASFKEYS